MLKAAALVAAALIVPCECFAPSAGATRLHRPSVNPTSLAPTMQVDTKLLAADATLIFAYSFARKLSGILLSPDFAAGRPIRIGAQSCDPLASPVLERRAASGDAASTSVS